ncbi:MAG: hypothetical protein RIS09_1224, partial [Actinomycetota bacterium]
RINLLSWYQQGIISRLLHGPIQNSIQVGLIKIQSTTSTDDQNEILGEVLQRIDEAIREVTNESNSSSLETEALAKIPDIWAGVAQIQVILPDDCRVRLMHDVAALSITVDLVHEVCSNAIRHGAATEIAITLNSSADTLVIQGSDNGNSYVPHTNPDGLGAYFIDSCTVTYERERKQGTNTYLLEIPLESTAFVRG